MKKIENHPHRQDLQIDLQQSNAYNPFSEKSKKMIRDMGNVELFELCETIPKLQCKECLLYWKLRIIYCTCGHLLNKSEANRGAIQCTLDLLSIPIHVIKKGRPHGHRFGKTNEQKDPHIKRCKKRGFEGIHDRFLTDPIFRESQLEIDRTEENCIEMDKDAQKDFTFSNDARRVLSIQKELVDLSQYIWKTGPMRDRSDFNDALTKLHRIHQESGEEQFRPIPFWKYQYWHQSSSSSSSWWQWSDSWWSS